MNNDYLLRFLLFLSNKSVTGNSISPIQFNLALQSGNLRHLKQKIGIPESYRPGAPFAPQQHEITQVLTDDILPFKVHMGAPGTMPLSLDTNGYAPLPTDFFYPSALSYRYFPNTDCTGDYKLKKIDVLTDQQWDYVIGSYLRPPSLEYPVCNFQHESIRFAPKGMWQVEFVYIKNPTIPVYDYYISADGEYIYLPVGLSHLLATDEEGSAGQTAGNTVISQSVELEWNDVNKLDILTLIMSYLGINMREGALAQFSEQQKATGL